MTLGKQAISAMDGSSPTSHCAPARRCSVRRGFQFAQGEVAVAAQGVDVAGIEQHVVQARHAQGARQPAREGQPLLHFGHAARAVGAQPFRCAEAGEIGQHRGAFRQESGRRPPAPAGCRPGSAGGRPGLRVRAPGGNPRPEGPASRPPAPPSGGPCSNWRSAHSRRVSCRHHLRAIGQLALFQPAAIGDRGQVGARRDFHPRVQRQQARGSGFRGSSGPAGRSSAGSG